MIGRVGKASKFESYGGRSLSHNQSAPREGGALNLPVQEGSGSRPPPCLQAFACTPEPVAMSAGC